MGTEYVETLVIGAGQSGLAMSEQLARRGLPHLVLERHRIAERWRSERWDSLSANGPAWHDRLPAIEIPGVDPDHFAPRDRMVDYFVRYADVIAAPVRCGVAVTKLARKTGGAGFEAKTSDGIITANNVVVATGPFQKPVVPAMVPADMGLFQIHSSAYRNPAQLPKGAVIVAGAGSSGTQIADELQRSGRTVYLCVGLHDRPPRSYRGRDYCWWLGVLGLWDAPARDPKKEHVTIAVSGAYGGHTVDFRRLANQGVILTGRAEAFRDDAMHFAPDLASNIAQGDENYLSVLDEADAYVAREKLDFPEEPEARMLTADPPCFREPLLQLNLRDAGVTSIIWATGYALDFGWIKEDIFDARGTPYNQRGVSDVDGLYFLGLSWLSRRASSFIFGAERDAAHLAEHIAARSAGSITTGVGDRGQTCKTMLS